MPDFVLTASSPLGGFDRDFGPVRLRELTGLAIVSVALPLGAEDAAMVALNRAFGCDMPAPGASALSKDGRERLLRLAPDQLFVLFDHATPDAEAHVAARLDGAAYTTDQTDGWVGLEMSGPGCRAALERICPVDLHPKAFAVGQFARTAMEHLGAIVLRSDDDRFVLLSASSSAGSFLHAVETSILDTC
ncbi:MAG: sarcosine oxidase subunit gamma [Roseovarius sp.]|nr:sarcosine oxidase subunit gamma [Roseovarius sp.]